METTTNEASDKCVEQKVPTCIVVLGMAGSGKTTFVTRIVSKLHQTGKPYVINLDPACCEVPYPANIGIVITFMLNFKLSMKINNKSLYFIC